MRSPRNVCVCLRCLTLYNSSGVRCILCESHPATMRVDLVPHGGAAVIREAREAVRHMPASDAETCRPLRDALARMRAKRRKR